MKQIWVYVEQHEGQLAPISKELLLMGRVLADRLHGQLAALLLGDNIAGFISALAGLKIDNIYMIDSSALGFYHPLIFTENIINLTNQFGQPDMILFGATYLGRDLAPAVAARLATGCAADCCGLDLDEDENLLQIVPGLGGTVYGTIVTPHCRPQVATIKPGMLDTSEDLTEASALAIGAPQLHQLEAVLPDRVEAIKLIEARPKPIKEEKLEGARRIVAGGAGIGGKEGWTLLENLAEQIEAAVGATRPAIDEGWADHDLMIGQSGKTVKPELYFGIGISGDMMHMVGIKGKGVRVAINTDPKAPIFQHVDYGIVADYQELVPALLDALQKRSPNS